MISKLFHDIRMLWSFYKGSRTIYDVQSPFIYDFIRNVCDTSKEFYAFNDIELIRNKLLNINKLIDFQDYGAGSRSKPGVQRRIKDIARHSATSKQGGRLIHNAAIHFHSKLILELGTSLGIGTAYLASADKKCKVITVEGDPSSAYIAQRNFELLGLDNIELIEGTFDGELPGILNANKDIDLVYMDGNHQKEATLRYYNLLTNSLRNKMVIILDDIYWSRGMLEAWITLQADTRVSLSIDLYDKGFLFINYDEIKQPQHFKIIKTRYKPWRIGLKQ